MTIEEYCLQQAKQEAKQKGIDLRTNVAKKQILQQTEKLLSVVTEKQKPSTEELSNFKTLTSTYSYKEGVTSVTSSRMSAIRSYANRNKTSVHIALYMLQCYTGVVAYPQHNVSKCLSIACM